MVPLSHTDGLKSKADISQTMNKKDNVGVCLQVGSPGSRDSVTLLGVVFPNPEPCSLCHLASCSSSFSLGLPCASPSQNAPHLQLFHCRGQDSLFRHCILFIAVVGNKNQGRGKKEERKRKDRRGKEGRESEIRGGGKNKGRRSEKGRKLGPF